MEQSPPSLATPNPCVHRRMKNLEGKMSLAQLSSHKLQEDLQPCAWISMYFNVFISMYFNVFQCVHEKDLVVLLKLLREEQGFERDAC